MAANAQSPSPAGKRLDIDEFIRKMLNLGSPGCSLTKAVKESEILQLCQLAQEVFMSQASLVEVDPPIRICGDVHGQYNDLMRLFDRGGFPPTSNYLFLGDYVDRGQQNLETICILLAYKVKYPKNMFLLRGNHECGFVNRVYGFYEECNRRYQSTRLWEVFQDVFNTMPFTGLVAGRIICMHGGLSPQLNSLDQLRQITRPANPTGPSMQFDLLWSDPDKFTIGWQPSTRGVAFLFGPDVVAESCKKLDIDLIARAHQVVQDGYEFFANRKLITIFSAPHYCGQFDNHAAMMTVDENLMCSLTILRPTTKPLRLANAGQ